MINNISVNDLWDKVRKGDTIAFRKFYQDYYPRLCYYANELLRDKFLSEETVQDTFCLLWEKREELFSQGNSLISYCYRLVHNRCMDILKHRQTKKGRTLQLLPSEAWAAVSEKYGFDEQLIEHLEARDIEQSINQIIAGLPDQCRDIFIQSRMENKSNDEIALQMNLSVNTVKTQIYRALKKIKEKIYFFF